MLYGKKVVLQQSLTGMDTGYRIHSGVDENNKLLYGNLDPNYWPDEDNTPLSDARKRMRENWDPSLISIEIPVPDIEMGDAFTTSFCNMDSGLMLKCEDHGQLLYCRRACQARVFVFSDFRENDKDLRKAMTLIRDEEVIVFSFQSFLEDWGRFKHGIIPEPDVSVQFSVGKKPRCRTGRTFISIELVPKAAEIILEKTCGTNKDCEMWTESLLKMFQTG